MTEDDKLIDSFFSGMLTKNENDLFLKKMEEDLVFKRQVEFEKQLRLNLNEREWSYTNQIDHQEVIEYQKLFEDSKTEELKNILKEITTHKPNRIKQKFHILYAVAAILVISIFVYSLYHTTNTTQQLYSQYFDKSELPSLTLRSNSPEQRKNIKVQRLFEEKKYKQTISFIEDSIGIDYINISTLQLYKGISLTETAQYNQSIEVYDKLIISDLLDAEKGYWFKALTYLKANNVEETTRNLKIIIKNKYYNYDKAKALLENLSK